MPKMLSPYFLTDWQTDFPEVCALLAEAWRDAQARRKRLTLTETPLSELDPTVKTDFIRV